MTTTRPSMTLEERLAPKLEQAEYLLLLVIATMLWIAGFVDVFTHTSQNGAILGLYSIPFFLVVLAFAAVLVTLIALILLPNSIDWLRQRIFFVQDRFWIGIPILVGFGAVIASMFFVERWLAFPLLAGSLIILILLATGTLLFAGWTERPVQLWRKIFGYTVIAFVAVELVLQGLSFLKILPSVQNLSGLYIPFGRVYQTNEGAVNAVTNQHGWYYPSFRLEKDSRRIIVTGDSFVQGLQVQPEQNTGVTLDKLINENAETESEVLSLGFPGYGPGLFMDERLFPFIIQPYAPEEIIVFFHLANDFQTITQPESGFPYYIIDGDGNVTIHPDDDDAPGNRHLLEHVVIEGYEANPARTFASHSFLINLLEIGIRNLTGRPATVPQFSTNLDSATEAQPFGASTFMFNKDSNDEAEHALEIATGLIAAYHAVLQDNDMTMRIVTIPAFPRRFYEQYQGTAWSSDIGDYDLLLPEQALIDFADENGIDLLPMGAYMKTAGLSVDGIQGLYFKDGTGHFSPEGHEFFANAIYACFYSDDAPINRCG